MKNYLLPAVGVAAIFGATSAAGQSGAAAPQTAAAARLPYAAVHDPQFISVADATFMNDDDRVIGLISGKTPKAYPAAILSQHGLVEDRSPKGPIAITW